MKYSKVLLCVCLTMALSTAAVAAKGKGYMGGDGVMAETPGGGGEAGPPDDLEGPTGDHGSVEGVLYGDLYVILRYQGGELKRVPAVNADGTPIMEPYLWTSPEGNAAWVQRQAWVEDVPAIGGEPILTEDFVDYKVYDEETGLPLEGPAGDEWWPAPTPSQCIQPVASFERWGALSSEENAAHPYHAVLELAEFNKIPLVMTYDPTWDRTEFTVGVVDALGNVDPYFIQPQTETSTAGSWYDPNNEWVTYVDGVLWTDLIQEVSFGRLNQMRAPDSVRKASFDEAIRSINKALAIRLDPVGRLLLTQYVYDDYLVYKESGIDPVYGVEVESGDPLIIGTAEKAIDSPLENLSIYLKMMQDGHLVTPGDERDTIDRSEQGGIPVDLMLGLEDGPSSELRPTVDIQKLIDAGLGYLVDVAAVTYWTYYERVLGEDGVTVVDYVLKTATDPTSIPTSAEDVQEWFGIPTSDGSTPTGPDFEFCAAALSAAADKGGKLTVDHVVYLNSIMGINKVVGTSEDGSIDYSETPQYFDYGALNGEDAYDRIALFDSRGWYGPPLENPSGDPVDHLGQVMVILNYVGTGGDPVPGVWAEFSIPILATDPVTGEYLYVPFRELGVDEAGIPNDSTATLDIAGFAQQADDNLSLIDFVHTYQIPGNR